MHSHVNVVYKGHDDRVRFCGPLVRLGGPSAAQQPVDIAVRPAIECFRQFHPEHHQKASIRTGGGRGLWLVCVCVWGSVCVVLRSMDRQTTSSVQTGKGREGR